MKTVTLVSGLTFPKDPDDVLQYEIDARVWQGTDTASAEVVTATGITATINGAGEVGPLLRLSGGVAGQTATVTIRVKIEISGQVQRQRDYTIAFKIADA